MNDQERENLIERIMVSWRDRPYPDYLRELFNVLEHVVDAKIADIPRPNTNVTVHQHRDSDEVARLKAEVETLKSQYGREQQLTHSLCRQRDVLSMQLHTLWGLAAALREGRDFDRLGSVDEKWSLAYEVLQGLAPRIAPAVSSRRG